MKNELRVIFRQILSIQKNIGKCEGIDLEVELKKLIAEFFSKIESQNNPVSACIPKMEAL